MRNEFYNLNTSFFFLWFGVCGAKNRSLAIILRFIYKPHFYWLAASTITTTTFGLQKL